MTNRQKAWIWPFCAVFIFSSFLIPAHGWAQQNDNWNQGNQNNDAQNNDGQNNAQNNQNNDQDNGSQDNDNWNDDNQSPDNDPPSRVARMNFTQGSVSFQPGGEGDWVDAVPNRPLTTGDNLWTDRDSRAELQVGSTSIRMGSEASLTFLQLDDRVLQLRLAQGSTLVRVRHLDDDDTVEIDTPNLAFMVQRSGEYRVDVQPDGQTTLIAVYQGRGEAIGGGNNYTIVGNQQASFSGDPDQGGLNYNINTLPSPDGFTRWSLDRDRHEDQSQSANYVSPEMTGYEDLDDNGSWSYAGNYGPVWYPRNIPAGWAPYRYGHWAWIAPWGWTWVDDASWGFAPFHYGRWAMIGAGWAWIPGPAAVRPVYAPALVAFVGGGGGFRLSASFGGGAGVAWFPLGPGEVFVPAYHVSRGYVNQVNVTNTVVNVTRITNVYNTYNTRNVTNVTNVNRITYVNQVNVTAVSRETFVNARPIAHNVVAVQARDIAAAPVGRMTGVEPIRGSVMGAGRPTKFAPPRAVIARQVVAEHVPVQPPVPFAQRQNKLAVRPVNPGMQPGTQPGVRPMPTTRPAGQPGQAGGQPGRPAVQPNSQPNSQPNPRPNSQPNAQPSGQPQMGRPEPVTNRPLQATPAAPVERQIPQAPKPVQAQPQPEPPTRPQPGMRAPEQNNNWNNGNGNRNDNNRNNGVPNNNVPNNVPNNGISNNGVPNNKVPNNGIPNNNSRTNNPNNNAGRPQPGQNPAPNDATPNQGWSHPQAKPAPPVQPKSENQARDEENKYRNWQQQTKPPQPPPANPQEKGKPVPPPAKDKDKK